MRCLLIATQAFHSATVIVLQENAGERPNTVRQAWFDDECPDWEMEGEQPTGARRRVAELLKPYKAGRLVNQIKRLAQDVDPLPPVERSPDPTDDFLLVRSEAGNAKRLVTGDKSGLLALGRHKATQIVSATDFLASLV